MMLEMILALALTTPGEWYMDADAAEVFRVMPQEQREKIHEILIRTKVSEPDEKWDDKHFHGFINVMRARVLGRSNPRIDPGYEQWLERKATQ